jgi:hypothetical protein
MKIYASGSNILVQDENGTLWMCGSNEHKQIFDTEVKYYEKLQYVNYILTGEIKSFHVCGKIVIIHMVNGDLYIKSLKSYLCINKDITIPFSISQCYYNSKITNLIKNTENMDTTETFILLDSNVSDVLFSDMNFMWLVEGKMYGLITKPNHNILKPFGIKLITKSNVPYYFRYMTSFDKIESGENLFHYKMASLHFLFYFNADVIQITYFNNTTEYDFNTSHFSHVNKYLRTVSLTLEDQVYYFSHSKNDFMIMRDSDIFQYCYNFYKPCMKIIDPVSLLPNERMLIPVSNDFTDEIFTKTDFPFMAVFENYLFCNISKASIYTQGDKNSYYYAFVLDDKIYIIGSKFFDDFEQHKIRTSEHDYYINILDVTGMTITTVDNIILAEINGKHYYIDLCNISVFTELEINYDYRSTIVIDKNLIDRKHKFKDSKKIYIYPHSKFMSIFEQFLAVMSQTPGLAAYIVELYNEKDEKAHGGGAEYNFYYDLIQIFKDRYLTDGLFIDFKWKELDSLSNKELYLIGRMISECIHQTSKEISIRLPLDLLEAIKKTPILVTELEFMLYNKDPDFFQSIYKLKFDKQKLSAINDGLNITYIEYLKSLCSYGQHPEKKDKLAEMAKGFCIYEIQNLNSMNYPTLEYYISGANKIDRTLLKSKLRLSFERGVNNHEKYESHIKSLVDCLSEKELSNWLVNWTGTNSIINGEYIVIIEKSKANPKNVLLSYGTCFQKMYIAENLFQDEKSKELLKTLITNLDGRMVG